MTDSLLSGRANKRPSTIKAPSVQKKSKTQMASAARGLTWRKKLLTFSVVLQLAAGFGGLLAAFGTEPSNEKPSSNLHERIDISEKEGNILMINSNIDAEQAFDGGLKAEPIAAAYLRGADTNVSLGSLKSGITAEQRELNQATPPTGIYFYEDILPTTRQDELSEEQVDPRTFSALSSSTTDDDYDSPNRRLGGQIVQKLMRLKVYTGLKKYAKYANYAGYNTYGAGTYTNYGGYGGYPAYPYSTASAASNYSGYNDYAGYSNYTGYSVPTPDVAVGYKKFSKYSEEPGQRYLASLLSKSRTSWWLSNKVSRLTDILGGVCSRGVDQPIMLSNGYESKEATFLAVLQNRERFVDLLAQELSNQIPVRWIGRMYSELQGQFSAVDSLDRDFAIAKMAPPGEALSSFRHSLRLDIPIDLYEFTGMGTYVQAPDGQVFLNAISRRPLIRATADTVIASCSKGKKGYKALLSMSQQAVRVVANLNCIMMVHTNINPSSFLITEKGLVFLGGLFQAVPQGTYLVQSYQFTGGSSPVFVPPELRDSAAYYSLTAQPSMDSWQLGMTLYTFWCDKISTASAGGLSFTDCRSQMPTEIQDLILGLTQADPTTRLIAENVALTHPAMLLPIYPDIPNQIDTNQDDDILLDTF